MRAALCALRRDERGIALVLSMTVMLVLAIALTSVIYFTSANSLSASHAKAEQNALALAEAGTNNALSVLENPDNAPYLMPGPLDTGPKLLDSSWVGKTYDGGLAQWKGQYEPDNPSGERWVITAQGTVKNPTGPSSAPIVRTLTTYVYVHLPASAGEQVDVWNWVYAAGVGNPCDVTFNNQGAMYSSVYVVGNLCLQNQANVQPPANLYVGRKLYNVQPNTGVGTKTTPVPAAYIGNGCQYQSNGVYYVPCLLDSGTGKAPKTNVFASSLVTSGPPPAIFANLQPPHVFWDERPGHSWYQMASPGPYHSCWDTSQRQYGPDGTPNSNGPVPAFDRMVWNSQLNRWVADDGFNEVPGGDAPFGPFNLTPDASYTCRTSRGELSWNNTTHVLTLKGVIFIDGDVTVQTKTNFVARYSGQAVLYAGGSFYMSNSKLCAVAASSDCDWDPTHWNPNLNLLIIATHSSGRQPGVLPGDGIEVKSSSFQGGVYADANVNLDTSSQVQGPIVTQGTLTMGNKFSSTFPAITILPVGVPGDPPVPYADPPDGFGG
jgi:hypothetical protein